MASRYPLITLLPVDTHSLGIYLLSYRDFYMFSYKTVGMISDGNCSPFLLSPTAPAPRTRCLGSQVARFARPFEARPVDPVRREVFPAAGSKLWYYVHAWLDGTHHYPSHHPSAIGERHGGEGLPDSALRAQKQEEEILLKHSAATDVPKGED